MNKFAKILCLTLILSTLCFAKGTLSIFTGGNDNAEIFVDEKKVITGSLRDYQLEPGTHLVEVKIEGDQVYYKTISIEDAKSMVITSSDFEKIDAPSVARMNRMAKAWREVKGSVGLGFHFGSPSTGITLKWWLSDRFGFQLNGWGGTYSTSYGSSSFNSYGGRLLVSISDKIVHDKAVQQAYLALGAGQDLTNSVVSYKSTEFSVGFENPSNEDWGTYSYYELGYENVDWYPLTKAGAKLSFGSMKYF